MSHFFARRNFNQQVQSLQCDFLSFAAAAALVVAVRACVFVAREEEAEKNSKNIMRCKRSNVYCLAGSSSSSSGDEKRAGEAAKSKHKLTSFSGILYALMKESRLGCMN
jgi:hypothetical protein